MRKKHIQYIIGVMIFGLSGLIYLQYKWVKDSIAVKEARFDQTVHEALEKVVQKVQQVELIQSVEQDHQRQKLITPPQQESYTNQHTHITRQNGKVIQQAQYTKVSIQKNVPPIPSTTVTNKHKVPKAFLGIYYNRDSVANGIYLDDVVVGSGAEKAGLHPGDLIVEINGKKANNNWILGKMISETGAGNTLALTYLREDRLCHTEATLSLPFRKKRLPYLGVYITSVQTIKNSGPRIQIINVDKGSLGERIGLKQYDIIEQLNQQPLRRASDMTTQLTQLNWQSPLQINIKRQKQLEEICYSLALETSHLAPSASTPSNSSSMGIYVEDRIQGTDTLMGVSITKIVTNGEAHKVGLQKNDVIIRFNKYEVNNFNDFRHGLMDWQDHRKGYMDILRQTSETIWDTLRLYFHPWQPQAVASSWTDFQAKYRMPKYMDRLLNEREQDNTSPILLGIEFPEQPTPSQKEVGVLVSKVIPNSPAHQAGLMKNDIIVAIDHHPTPNGDSLLSILKHYQPNQEIVIDYKRPSPIKRHHEDQELYSNFPKPSDTSFFTQKHHIMLDKKMEEVMIQEGVDMPSGWTPQTKAQLVGRETAIEQIMMVYRSNFENFIYELAFSDKSIKERIPQQKLEKILSTTFKDAGINIPFEYGVLSSNQQIIYNSQPTAIAPVLLNYPYHKQILNHSILSYPAELRIRFPEQTHFLWNRSFFHLLASLLFNLIIMGTFAYTIYIIIRQKKFSEMKTDFINNMTHELKTPISTIKLACEILKDQNLPKTEQRIARYAGIIDDENERLQNHVEKVLHFARLEKGNLKLNKETLDIHELVNEAIQKISLQIRKREGSIAYYLDALQPTVFGDKLHLTNVIYNLLDNAIKYSQDAPEITVYTQNTTDGLQVAIEDKGIGMSKEAVKHIFDKFYRVSTGNRHDVKGFGLGLSYVKLMVEAHEGTVSAKSKLKKGSTVIFTLPISRKTLDFRRET